MKKSSSKYISLESISLVDLFKEEAGAIGIYFPEITNDRSMRETIAKISAQAKAYASHANKKCVVKSVVTLEQDDANDSPIAFKYLKVVVTPPDEFTAAGMAYMKSIEMKTV